MTKTTQIARARAGEITPQIATVAKNELVDPEIIREGVATGRIVIPANIHHPSLEPVGIGRSLKTKINANIGNSTLSSCPQQEIEKLHTALSYGADTVMDLSTGASITNIRKAIIANSPAPIGTVPIYEALSRVNSSEEFNDKLIVDVIRERYPDFQPCAYLNGTERPDHFKWLLTMRFGTKDKIYGYGGPRFMELSQTLHHLLKGTYLAYSSPDVLHRGKSMLLLSPLDKGLARTATSYLHDLVRTPAMLFEKLHLQSVTIIQPADFMPNGAFSMCDGCPDITVWEDKLVWSCRLEELLNFGDWVHATPAKETPQ